MLFPEIFYGDSFSVAGEFARYTLTTKTSKYMKQVQICIFLVTHIPINPENIPLNYTLIREGFYKRLKRDAILYRALHLHLHL